MVNEVKVQLTSSELVVNVFDTKFECTRSSNVAVIDRMKIQNLSFSPKGCMLKFRAPLGKRCWYVYVKRRKRWRTTWPATGQVGNIKSYNMEEVAPCGLVHFHRLNCYRNKPRAQRMG